MPCLRLQTFGTFYYSAEEQLGTLMQYYRLPWLSMRRWGAGAGVRAGVRGGRSPPPLHALYTCAARGCCSALNPWAYSSP